jgi:hypothetical protein
MRLKEKEERILDLCKLKWLKCSLGHFLLLTYNKVTQFDLRVIDLENKLTKYMNIILSISLLINLLYFLLITSWKLQTCKNFHVTSFQCTRAVYQIYI